MDTAEPASGDSTVRAVDLEGSETEISAPMLHTRRAMFPLGVHGEQDSTSFL